MIAFRIATLVVGAAMLAFSAWLSRPRPYNINGGLTGSGSAVAIVAVALLICALFLPQVTG